ncbi:MAG: outer membrane lipid asymmetry maintenance protein MlaD [Rickettsiaceae bacterium]
MSDSKSNTIETIVGFAIIVASIVFTFFVYNTNSVSYNEKSYRVTAKFQNAEGIYDGSDIMIAGIKVGTVESMSLDKENFFAIMTMRINNDVKLPKDSQAAIVTNGFLGGKFISIVPGADDVDMEPNGHIKYTQSSVNIESLIKDFAYSAMNKK